MSEAAPWLRVFKRRGKCFSYSWAGRRKEFFYSTAYYTGVFSHVMPYLVSSVLTTHTILTPRIFKVLFKRSWYQRQVESKKGKT